MNKSSMKKKTIFLNSYKLLSSKKKQNLVSECVLDTIIFWTTRDQYIRD